MEMKNIKITVVIIIAITIGLIIFNVHGRFTLKDMLIFALVGLGSLAILTIFYFWPKRNKETNN